MKYNCQHGSNAKCVHCIDQEFMQDTKHISFEEYLNKSKKNCKHQSDQRCNNCMPPSAFNYKVNLSCKKHPPFPQAMCNGCLPDNCVVKR